MTLKEAHEIQRKELISLRAEVKRLKSGTFSDKDMIALEKENRKLRDSVSKLTHSLDLHKHWLELARERNESLDFTLHAEIDRLKEDYSALMLKYQKLLDDYNAVSDSNEKLKAQMNHDHENSSIPSSKERFPKKIKNSRVKSDRKQGAQKGHSGHKRPHMEPTSPVIMIPVPEHITSDPDYYLTGRNITKQVCDIHINVSVTEYSTPEYRSRSTGKRGHAPFPDGLRNEFNYGPNAKALAFLLNNYCNVSIEKTRELVKNLSDSRIILSNGLINSLPKQFSDNTEEERKRIFDRLLMAPVMYSDATPGRVNGKTVQVILCGNEDEVLYTFREHKGHEGLKGTPVEEYQQILVHDHDKTYYSYGADHQECLAHVLRYLQDSIENEPELSWNRRMKEFLTSLVHIHKNDRSRFTDDFIAQKEADYRSIIELAETEYQQNPPKKYYPDGFNLYKRLDQYWKNHLLFMRHPEVGYTNNLSERALRKFKRKQCQAVTFRSKRSVEYLCNCMSIIETNRIYDANLFKLTSSIFT